MDDERTRSREVAALEEAMGLFPEARATIVTPSERGVESTAHGDIRVLPAWRWSLARETAPA